MSDYCRKFFSCSEKAAAVAIETTTVVDMPTTQKKKRKRKANQDKERKKTRGCVSEKKVNKRERKRETSLKSGNIK